MSPTTTDLPEADVQPRRAHTEPFATNQLAYDTIFYGKCPKCAALHNDVAQQLDILAPVEIKCSKCLYPLLAVDAASQNDNSVRFPQFRPDERLGDFKLTIRRTNTFDSRNGDMVRPPNGQPSPLQNQVNASPTNTSNDAPGSPNAIPLGISVSAPEAGDGGEIQHVASQTKKKRHRTGSVFIDMVNRVVLKGRGWKLRLHKVSTPTNQTSSPQTSQPGTQPPPNPASQAAVSQHTAQEPAEAPNHPVQADRSTQIRHLTPHQETPGDDSRSGTAVQESEPDQSQETTQQAVRFAEFSTPPRSQTPGTHLPRRTDTEATDTSSRSGGEGTSQFDVTSNEANSQFDVTSTGATKMSGTSAHVPSLKSDTGSDDSDEDDDDNDHARRSSSRPGILTRESRRQQETNFVSLVGGWADPPANIITTPTRIRSPSQTSTSTPADLLSLENQNE